MKQRRVMKVLCGMTVLLLSCNGNTPKEKNSGADLQQSHRLEIPQPPVMLPDSEKISYMAAHYWDAFDFADTTWIADTASLEQAFSGWVYILGNMPLSRAVQYSGEPVRKAENHPAMLLHLAGIAEHYFADPNSPFRSEELYIPVLEAVLASQSVDTIYKIRPRARLEAALKNRPGMVAADFGYVTASGRKGRLSQMKGEYVLLMFYNPGCADCRRVEEYIKVSEVFAPLIASGRLAVLAVYPDKDLDLWREHLPEMPEKWTVGYDAGQTVTEKELYDLPAIPNLYLLDGQKKVLLKDAPVEQIEAYLYSR